MKTRYDSGIAFNHDGVHIIDNGTTTAVTHTIAECQHFKAVKAMGGNITIASFDDAAEITGKKTGLVITAGDTLLVKFKTITLDAASVGDAVLTKFVA